MKTKEETIDTSFGLVKVIRNEPTEEERQAAMDADLRARVEARAREIHEEALAQEYARRHYPAADVGVTQLWPDPNP